MTEQPYNKNGLIFWDEHEIARREALVPLIKLALQNLLLKTNPAWAMVRVEAPILTPVSLIGQEYINQGNVYSIKEDDLANTQKGLTICDTEYTNQ